MNGYMEERYIKGEVVGSGANGMVYKAFDKHLKRYVAVKRINREEEWAWKEAEVLKGLKHLSIPIIYDVVRAEESIYIVMEYMEGANLLSVLEAGEIFEEKRAVEIAMRIGESLQYLHNLSEKIIYRDLKPANLILDGKDHVKLIDFDSAFAGKDVERSKIQTGTFGYSAPEQFEANGVVDERSDIYAFGATLFHMLTGKNPSKPPYRIYKIREINPFISEGLERIVEKCMEREREKRYETMEQVMEALKGYEQKKRRRIGRVRKKYLVEEKKNIFLTCKKGGGLFLFLFVLFGFVLPIQAKEEAQLLPLTLYNQKREKIIIKDGCFYETNGDFHMAVPYFLLEEQREMEVTVTCTDLESGESWKKVVLLRAK